jgi:HEAT repeat protein
MQRLSRILKNASCHGALVAALWLCGESAAFAQTAAESREAMLARGWSRLAAGQPAEAATVAERMLARGARDHDALSLGIAARVAERKPIAALDFYEQWLKASRAEDVFALEHVARGIVEEIASGADRGLALQALQALVRAGVPGASDRLAGLRKAADSAAVRPEARIEALKAAGTGSVPALREIMRDQKGPVRASALRALAALDAHDATEEARGFLNDPDPLVRASAAIALARFGDPAGESRVKEMLASPVAEYRLLAAEAYAGRGEGTWIGALEPLLEDPNGLNRLRAAELLAPIRPELARPVLEKAAADPNPVVRADAARILASPETRLGSEASLPVFRRMMRDADPAVRVQGAAGVITLATRGR